MIPFQGNDGIGRGRPTTMGVVLAAGAGRRYGGPKIVAEQGNWLDLALGALRDGGCDFVGLCMGARFVDPPPGVLGITVDDWDEGLGASVRAALREAIAADAQRLVLHLVDLPDVTAEVVRRLLGSGSGPHHLARATYATSPGHPVVVGRAHFEAMAATLHGDEGGRSYLVEHQVEAVECGDLASGTDIDVRA